MHRLFWGFAVGTAALLACADGADAGAGLDPDELVFNELNGAGTEWLELYNAGNAVDLSGYAIADTDPDTGLARPSAAMRFPPGTSLASAGFLLVLLGKEEGVAAGPYPAAACLAQVTSGCFYATFAISVARGEEVHLLSPDDMVLSSVRYPADLAFEPESGLSACRLPDGTGELGTCLATPGAPNVAP
jgi:hypothetical protein